MLPAPADPCTPVALHSPVRRTFAVNARGKVSFSSPTGLVSRRNDREGEMVDTSTGTS